jgi:tRNA(Arg) A34 adenosine deaminase TadA
MGKVDLMTAGTFTLHLPGWLTAALPPAGTLFSTVEERMRLMIDLARQHVLMRTGGPFAAGIFDLDNGGRLVAPGVNLVLSASTSIAHAEIVAIALAQQSLGDYDLGREGRRLELVTSTEPCAMCYGAVPWSGVRSLVCGARRTDASRVGFDEGDKPPNWIAALQRRGIAVRRDVLRLEAAALLKEYGATGGIIYNARKEQ